MDTILKGNLWMLNFELIQGKLHNKLADRSLPNENPDR